MDILMLGDRSAGLVSIFRAGCAVVEIENVRRMLKSNLARAESVTVPQLASRPPSKIDPPRTFWSFCLGRSERDWTTLAEHTGRHHPALSPRGLPQKKFFGWGPQQQQRTEPPGWQFLLETLALKCFFARLASNLPAPMYSIAIPTNPSPTLSPSRDRLQTRRGASTLAATAFGPRRRTKIWGQNTRCRT